MAEPHRVSDFIWGCIFKWIYLHRHHLVNVTDVIPDETLCGKPVKSCRYWIAMYTPRLENQKYRYCKDCESLYPIYVIGQ